MNILNKTLKIFQSFFLAIFMITFAIGVTILFRPYYYLNITLLELDINGDCTYEEAKEAYNDLLDYLVFNEEFKVGIFEYSEEGKSHFEDCKRLFKFNFICLGISFLYLAVIFILQKLNKIKLEYKYFSPGIYSIIGVGIIFLILSIWGIIDFYSLFETFHAIAFPGKSNWLFFPSTDPVIKILPEKLWVNYCIFIVFIIIIFIVTFIIIEIKRRKNINKIK